MTRPLRNHQQGLGVARDRITVDQFLAQWPEEFVKKGRRAKTHAAYSEMVRLYLVPGLGRHHLQRQGWTVGPWHRSASGGARYRLVSDELGATAAELEAGGPADKAHRSINARIARARFPVMRTLEGGSAGLGGTSRVKVRCSAIELGLRTSRRRSRRRPASRASVRRPM